MTPRFRSVGRGALAGAMLLSAAVGCAKNAAAPSRVPWNACDFLPGLAVTVALDGGAPDAGPFMLSGATDFPWPGPNPGASWALKTAQSRCDYTVEVAGSPVDVALAARLSGSDDPSLASIQDLLASEGYPPTEAVPLSAFTDPASCVTGALWTSIAFGGDASAKRRGELHVLLSTPPAANTGCAPAPGDESKESLYAYLVLFITGNADLDAQAEREAAIFLMNGAVHNAREAMSAIAREQREATDAGDDSGAGPTVTVPQDGGPGSVALADYPGAAAAALCGRLEACCSAAERAAGSIPSGSAATCSAFVTAAFDLALTGTAQSIASAALAYDPVGAATCLDAYQATSCDLLKPGGVAIPCLTAFSARVTSSGACHSDLDCIGGYCRVDLGDAGNAAGAAAVPTGTCRPVAALGAACDVDPSCASGSCQSNVCVQAIARPWCEGI